MKIATYNIWNSDRGMPAREQLIVDEINDVDADVICLQEVKEEAYKMLKTKMKNYKYSYYHNLENEYDGLAVFSKYPVEYNVGFDCAVSVTVDCNNLNFLIINVHLPWDSMLNKEKYIVEIVDGTKDIVADYAFILGDFNCSDNSSVHHFLTAERTLYGAEVNPYWEDLSQVSTQIKNTSPEYTLDIRNNPRWKDKDHAYTSSRMDRIYLRDAFPKPSPEFIGFWVFGKKIDKQSGYSASDHYGVAAQVKF